uniref:Non-haem dioxygenase N-terminal domain-containing protein n=1 Tax=Alexandrium catenella TaxID=2925 RepID=A0A7S1KZS4_ALECA
MAKGSFYANPLFDDAAEGDEEVRAKYPYACSRNVWPEELPELQSAFKEMGRLLGSVAKLVLQQCDSMVQAQTGRHPQLVETTFGCSRMVAGRLLHYFPLDEGAEAGSAANWCGWHNDNSSITGLVPAVWLDDATGEEAGCPPSSEGGLYVQGRSGNVRKVAMPPDCLGFQVGEAAQILSGGVLRATPHHVRGHVSKPGEGRLSRETFACFFEPNWDKHIGPPEGAELADVFRDEETELIPPLSTRFRPDSATNTVEFGKLLGDSFQEYYKHNGN